MANRTPRGKLVTRRRRLQIKSKKAKTKGGSQTCLEHTALPEDVQEQQDSAVIDLEVSPLASIFSENPPSLLQIQLPTSYSSTYNESPDPSPFSPLAEVPRQSFFSASTSNGSDESPNPSTFSPLPVPGQSLILNFDNSQTLPLFNVFDPESSREPFLNSWIQIMTASVERPSRNRSEWDLDGERNGNWDDALSYYTSAYSRTESTDYGVYARRMALSDASGLEDSSYIQNLEEGTMAL